MRVSACMRYARSAFKDARYAQNLNVNDEVRAFECAAAENGHGKRWRKARVCAENGPIIKSNDRPHANDKIITTKITQRERSVQRDESVNEKNVCNRRTKSVSATTNEQVCDDRTTAKRRNAMK